MFTELEPQVPATATIGISVGAATGAGQVARLHGSGLQTQCLRDGPQRFRAVPFLGAVVFVNDFALCIHQQRQRQAIGTNMFSSCSLLSMKWLKVVFDFVRNPLAASG